MFGMHTDPLLLDRLAAASARPITRAEVRAQRLSWIRSMTDATVGEIIAVVPELAD